MGELRSAVDALAALDLDDLDNATLGELIVEVSRQHDRLDGIRHRLVGERDRRLAWKADGARSEKHWLADHCRMSPAEAAARANTARNLDRLPETGPVADLGRRPLRPRQPPPTAHPEGTDLGRPIWTICAYCAGEDHRDVHEQGWTLIRGPDGHWTARPP